jgi:multicomponent Na+:H+ antiporter subunit D
VAGSTIEATGEKYIDKMAGLGRKMPITMAIFTLGALSMVGIPLFIGFNSKWFFGMAIVDSSQIWLMIILALSAMLNGCYYFPIVIRAYLGKEAKAAQAAKVSIERPIKNLIPIMVLAGLIVVLALVASPIYDYLNYAISRI